MMYISVKRKSILIAFLSKLFSIPTTATALRFMCEAGAVSEGCWVDNVKIIAE